MRPASILPPFLIIATGLALASAQAHAAGGGGGHGEAAKESKEEASGDRKMSAPNIVTPVVRNGKLVNYLFVSVDVEFTDKANVMQLRDRAHFLRDALLRASHRSALADPNDDFKLNYLAANPVLADATREALGAANVKKVTITGVDSLNRR